MVFPIEKFSNYLCLVQSTDLCAYHSENELTKENKLMVFIFMMKLREMYEQEIQSAVDKIFNTGETFFFRSVFKAILSRCVKLSKNATYLHFMLASALVKQVVCANFCSTKCFTLPKIASLALIAVYNRCYKDCFNRGQKSETLESYCFILNFVLAKEKSVKQRKDLSPFAELEISKLIASLNDVDDNHFELTDDEEVMLNDVFLGACSEDFIEDDVEFAKSKPSLEETGSDDTMEYSISSCNPLREVMCEFCGFDCTRFVLDFCIASVSKMKVKKEI